jgi:hypothetical protein
MSDVGLPTVRPKHSRSTSITTKKTTSHQRKPSLNQQQLPTPTSEKRNSRPILTSTNSSSLNTTKSIGHGHSPRFFNSIILRIHAFLNPSGPLLPHAKHGSAFGGTSKPSFLTMVFQSRVMRFIALFYVIFSVFLSLNHSWKYLTQPSDNNVSLRETNSHLDEQFNQDWKPQRTYDQGKI